MNTLDTVVGGQYGSEAKGHATKQIVEMRLSENPRYVVNVRVGGPNAGHTAYDAKGTRWALRQVPIGVVLGNRKGLMLQIAAGSEIDISVLFEEIITLRSAGLLQPWALSISPEATVIDPEHKANEQSLVGEIGSTGKGIGAARASRLMRKASRVVDLPWLRDLLDSLKVGVGEWSFLADASYVIEGTQGYALGLHAGHYPQCTSGDCRAIDFMSQAGLNPWQFGINTVWVVGRVYPIRVAGNSGPMRDETTWEELGLPVEKTTVTQKVRRVGKEDWALLAQAVEANGPNNVRVALSMVDHKFPELANERYSKNDPKWEEADRWMDELETILGAPIFLVMTGPNAASWRG